ncbi:hypothetical protein, partial [Mesorhizobium sp. M4B.F.Ca.ET.013.02.1.1]|uniref:hypothetical protein n=1 Tax=Mesorhizobium sp. M4B.F.Ca.ET.013.02.1.1 TaxID=2496755 RepID=UPI000FD2382E
AATADEAIENAHSALLEWRLVPAPKRGELIRLLGLVGPKLGFRPSLETCSLWVFLPAFSCRKSGRTQDERGWHPQSVHSQRSLWVSAPTFFIRSATWPISQLRADQAR